eukprot:SAG11_NODE_33605_length_276_cov_0.870056_1_plen_26_part_10
MSVPAAIGRLGSGHVAPHNILSKYIK